MGKKFVEDEAPPPPAGAPLWVLSYGDMVTNLLVFFVLLVAFANMDVKKFQELAKSLNNAFNSPNKIDSLDFQKGLFQTMETSTNVVDLKEQENLMLFQQAKKLVKQNKIGEDVDMQLEKDGIRLRVKGSALFGLGSAELNPDMYGALDNIKDMLDKHDYTLIVEGHTDNVPVKSTKFPTNWELSSARAISVIRYFMEKKGVPSERLMAVGYADTHPLVDNATEENRAKNRRVEFKFEQPLLKKYKQETGATKPIPQIDIFEQKTKKQDVIKLFKEEDLLQKLKDVK